MNFTILFTEHTPLNYYLKPFYIHVEEKQVNKELKDKLKKQTHLVSKILGQAQFGLSVYDMTEKR